MDNATSNAIQVATQFDTEVLAPRTEIWTRGEQEVARPDNPVPDCPSCPTGN